MCDMPRFFGPAMPQAIAVPTDCAEARGLKWREAAMRDIAQARRAAELGQL
jgi:hypothetical protein